MHEDFSGNLEQPLLEYQKKDKIQIVVTEQKPNDHSFFSDISFAALVVPYLDWKNTDALITVSKIWLMASIDCRESRGKKDEKAVLTVRTEALGHLKGLIDSEHESKLSGLLDSIVNKIILGSTFKNALAPLQVSASALDNRAKSKADETISNLRCLAACCVLPSQLSGLGLMVLVFMTFAFLDKKNYEKLAALETPAIVFGSTVALTLLCLCICIKPLNAWTRSLPAKIRLREYKREVTRLAKESSPEKAKLELTIRQLLWHQNPPKKTQTIAYAEKEKITEKENKKVFA